tara:strand:- start:94 stop:399 length:306 start_codon:yes stop_codon:yes gene_type:complete
MGKKKKARAKAKKQKKLMMLKTHQDREKEINEIKMKLISLNFSTEMVDIKKIFDLLDKYIEDGESVQEKIPIRGTQRICELYLTNKKHITNQICLKFNESV